MKNEAVNEIKFHNSLKKNSNNDKNNINKNNNINIKHKKDNSNIINISEEENIYSINEKNDNISNEDKNDELLYNNENNKEELKQIFLNEIFYQKYSAKNYEINKKYFKEIDIPKDGNCFFRCISYYFYKNIDQHMEIRDSIYKYIVENKEDFYIFFQGNDENNFDIISPEELLQDYIIENNKEGEYAGDIEYSAKCKLYNMHILYYQMVM